MASRKIEVSVGDEYDSLVVVSELPSKKRASGGTARMFLCRCECGKELCVELKNLRSRHTRSCGCSRSSVPPRRSDLSPSSLEKMRLGYKNREDYHGMEGSPEWSVWKGIKRRCYQVRARGYCRYGGRGIVMCSGWKSSFKSFFADMGDRPSLEHSIDRRDGDKNYSCGHCEECVEKGWTANCRWATRAEQRRNAKNICMLTFQGETMCMADWAKRKGMSKVTLHSRLNAGWSLSDALLTPVREKLTDQQFMQIPESKRNCDWRREADRRANRFSGT